MFGSESPAEDLRFGMFGSEALAWHLRVGSLVWNLGLGDTKREMVGKPRDWLMVSPFKIASKNPYS